MKPERSTLHLAPCFVFCFFVVVFSARTNARVHHSDSLTERSFDAHGSLKRTFPVAGNRPLCGCKCTSAYQSVLRETGRDDKEQLQVNHNDDDLSEK